MKNMTEGDVRDLVWKKIGELGSQAAFARAHGFTPSFLSDVLLGRRGVSRAILDAVGLEEVTSYRPKPKSAA